MRLIFVDEAGTSAKEPVTVVVGVIANADKHVMAADGLVREMLGAVPPHLQDGFVFSAKDVFSSPRYKETWSPTDRLRLLLNMMTVPRRLGMSICLSAVWRDAPKEGGVTRPRPEQFQHFMAFANCIAVADANIRKHAAWNEVAMVIAEDHQEMRRRLRDTPSMWRDRSLHLLPSQFRRIPADKAAGYLTQSGEFRVTRIRGPVHFVKKGEDLLVQVADACAFGFRRNLAGEELGDQFVNAICGRPDAIAHYASPCGMTCWWAENDEPPPSA